MQAPECASPGAFGGWQGEGGGPPPAVPLPSLLLKSKLPVAFATPNHCFGRAPCASLPESLRLPKAGRSWPLQSLPTFFSRVAVDAPAPFSDTSQRTLRFCARFARVVGTPTARRLEASIILPFTDSYCANARVWGPECKLAATTSINPSLARVVMSSTACQNAALRPLFIAIG